MNEIFKETIEIICQIQGILFHFNCIIIVRKYAFSINYRNYSTFFKNTMGITIITLRSSSMSPDQDQRRDLPAGGLNIPPKQFQGRSPSSIGQ